MGLNIISTGGIVSRKISHEDNQTSNQGPGLSWGIITRGGR